MRYIILALLLIMPLYGCAPSDEGFRPINLIEVSTYRKGHIALVECEDGSRKKLYTDDGRFWYVYPSGEFVGWDENEALEKMWENRCNIKPWNPLGDCTRQRRAG